MALIQRLVAEGYNRGDPTVVEALYAPIVALNDQPFSVAELKAAVTLLPTVIRGFHVTVEPLLTAGKFIAVSWTIHRRVAAGDADSVGAAPAPSWTGRRLFHIVEGKIVAEWFNRAADQQLQELDMVQRWEAFATCSRGGQRQGQRQST
jgi:hypothetical protein